jgi:hypothetical protein
VRVRILAEAELEAREAARWYEERRQGLGNQLLDAIARGLEAVEEDPRRFAVLETIHSSREVRRYLVPRFPYTLIYEVRPDEVLVLAVAHVRRRPNYWKRRTD